MCPFCQCLVHLLVRCSACALLHFPKVQGVWNLWPQWQRRLLSTVVLNRPNPALVGEHPHSCPGQPAIPLALISASPALAEDAVY